MKIATFAIAALAAALLVASPRVEAAVNATGLSNLGAASITTRVDQSTLHPTMKKGARHAAAKKGTHLKQRHASRTKAHRARHASKSSQLKHKRAYRPSQKLSKTQNRTGTH